MITAVDTNILLDLLIPNPAQSASSRAALDEAADAGGISLCEPVVAEIAPRFPSLRELARFVDDLGAEIVRSSAEALYRAGERWREYVASRSRSMQCAACGARQSVRCVRCGATVVARQHVIADFLIGGHASFHADRLMTRDRGFYARYFPDLTLV